MRARCSRRDRKESAREVRHDRGCGLDVHAQTGVACLSTKGRKEIRPVSTLTDEVLKLADWLTSAGCTPGAMESTGVYGKPVCNLLAGVVTVSLVTARHLKAVPGRKPDVRDCEWWADRLRHGVVKASLIAPVEMRELRELTRSRQTRVTAHPAVAKRRQKLREGANSKLGQGTSDVRGRNGWLRRRALAGRLTQAQRWVLAEFLVRLAEVEAALSRVETRMGEEVAHCSDPFVQAAVEWLESIPGVGERTAQTSIAAIGVAMGRFPAAQHLARWAGGCPGTNESAGKRKSGRRPRGASPGARPWWKPPGRRLGPRGHTGEL